jgi:selenocysteine lyase/cysteine desulfurase
MPPNLKSFADAPLPRNLFFGLDSGQIHLCAGSESPLLRATQIALDSYAKARSEGHAGRAWLEAAREDARRRCAALLNVPEQASRIAFTSSTGHALDVILRTVDWRAGDEILSFAEEYPSVVLAGQWLKPFGVDTRLIPTGETPEDALIAAAGPRTRMVIISHVSYRTGLRLDLAKLSAAFRKQNIPFVVDAGHSLGVLPVDASLCDAVVSCSHKFMMGPHGVGILYLARTGEPPQSASRGWYSKDSVDNFSVRNGEPSFTFKPGATAYEIGNPAFILLLGLIESLKAQEQAGPAAIAEQALGLASTLRSELARRGIECWTPETASRHGTSVAIPGDAGNRLHAALAQRGILVAKGVGRLRVSFHGYNNGADLEAVMQAVAKLN